MNAITGTPVNLNFLPINNFQFQIKKLPNVQFTCQKANLPGLSLPAAERETPFVKDPHPGDQITFEELEITYHVDELLANYLEIHKWIRAIGFDESYDQFAAIADQASQLSGNGIYSDASLIIMDSSKNPKFQVDFKDLVPISLSGIQFSTVEQDVIYAITTAQFRYLNYDINPVT